MNKTPERPRENFNALDRPIEWYRLPFAIKLAVLNLPIRWGCSADLLSVATV